MVRIEDIEQARGRLREHIYESPCPRSQQLSERCGCHLYLKLENLQMTGSFKERGAGNRVLLLDAEERAAGVVAASAGNHAQGLAFAAQRQRVQATIVMPRNTPLIKVSATRRHGAVVVLHGDSYDEAATEAERLAHKDGLTPVHAFDDDAVIAGQGSIGLELLEQVPELDAVVVPVGGGGLIGGLATAVKSLRPEVKVYGVEPTRLASMAAAQTAGAPVELAASPTIADGIAVRRVSPRTLELCQRHVDAMVQVDEEELAEAILVLLEEEKTVAEGAGAAPLAAVLQGKLPVAGKRVVCLLAGGNIDVNLLSRIIDRGLLRSGRAMRLRIQLTDRPGSLAALLSAVADAQANVLQVAHDRLQLSTGLARAVVELVLETRGFDHVTQVRHAIEAAGFVVEA